MTRNVRGRSWWFECDTWPALPECARLGPFPTQRAIPLAPMAGLGWFVARMWGDCCPECWPLFCAAGLTDHPAPWRTTWPAHS